MMKPIAPKSQTATSKRLSLVTWNIDAFSPQPITRTKLILSQILNTRTPPDIIFLQEVRSPVRTSLLNDPNIRAAFLTTDAEDDASFAHGRFATMTLLSKKRFISGLPMQEEGAESKQRNQFLIGHVTRAILPSKYGRDGLCVDIMPQQAPGMVIRLINVHLDSLWATSSYRIQQMETLGNILRERGCSGGIIAGDFNAINPEDHDLIDKNGMIDAWVSLHGTSNTDGGTYRVGVKPGTGSRLDRVAMLGLKMTKMEVLRPGPINVLKPGAKFYKLKSIPWSDHCGLKCTITL
jgi:tyrosyl-DNA phosphodiesterase 2